MDEAHLVRIHEARIAHHVAPVRQIDCQHRAASPLHCRGAVIVKVLVVVGTDVAPRELRFDVLEELGIDGHEILRLAVLGTLLDHPDLVVALDDRRGHLTDLLGLQDRVVNFAVEDHFARFAHTLRAQRIRLAGPAQRRFRLLPRLEHRLVRPSRSERRPRILAGIQVGGRSPSLPGPHASDPAPNTSPVVA